MLGGGDAPRQIAYTANAGTSTLSSYRIARSGRLELAVFDGDYARASAFESRTDFSACSP
jgi:hypothetical protein